MTQLKKYSLSMQNNHVPQIKITISTPSTPCAPTIIYLSKEVSLSGYFRDPFSDCELY